jgi:steroid 5-alpha reductase family enzyme
VVTYLTAGLVAWIVTHRLTGAEPLLLLALANLAATLVVFTCSLAWDNSSLYDPYWSLAPLPIVLFWMGRDEPGVSGVRQLLVLALVGLWGARLTWNWLRRWEGLAHEDWRYADFRESWGRYYWPLSLVGIHLVPTAIVFLACLPLWPALVAARHPVGVIDGLALAVAAAGIAIETIADRQLYDFQRSGHPVGALLERGLWARSRHPNYLGELLFWWGLWLFGLAGDPGFRWTIAGPLVITALFLGVSIPLKERRMAARRPAFAAYRRRVPILIPWIP